MVDTQSEQFITLLTDALRSGPGSPEWHQAVKVLRDGAGQPGIDEYQLLYTARERLEAGKDYRSVRAGPGFTRKLMEGVEELATAGNGPGGVPTASLIALIAAGVLLGVVVLIAVLLLRQPANPQQQKVEELNSIIFGNKFLSASFTGPATNTVETPDGFARFGDLPLVIRQGDLRPSTQPTSTPATNGASDAYRIGGLVSAAALPADQPLEVDVTLKIGKPAADEGIFQIFISDEPITSANAAGGHALVWQLKAGEARVFQADGKAAPQAEKLPGWQNVPIKLALNRDTTLIEVAGKRLYAGPHLLDPAKPRYAGVRFFRRAAEKSEHLGLASTVLQKP
jgi:hypothetical protein